MTAEECSNADGKKVEVLFRPNRGEPFKTEGIIGGWVSLNQLNAFKAGTLSRIPVQVVGEFESRLFPIEEVTLI